MMNLLSSFLIVLVVLYSSKNVRAKVSSCYVGSSSISSTLNSETTGIVPKKCPSDQNDCCVRRLFYTENSVEVKLVHECSSNKTKKGWENKYKNDWFICYTNDCNTIEENTVSSCYFGLSYTSYLNYNYDINVTIKNCLPGLGKKCARISTDKKTNWEHNYGCAYSNFNYEIKTDMFGYTINKFDCLSDNCNRVIESTNFIGPYSSNKPLNSTKPNSGTICNFMDQNKLIFYLTVQIFFYIFFSI